MERTRRSLKLLVVLVVFGLPALLFSLRVGVGAHRAAPVVDQVFEEAARLGMQVFPDSLYAVDQMPADQIPPGAVEQARFFDQTVQTFHRDPVDSTMLYWPLLIVGGAALSIWALIGTAVSAALGGRLALIEALFTIVVLAGLWLPMWYYRDVIDVVSYFVD